MPSAKEIGRRAAEMERKQPSPNNGATMYPFRLRIARRERDKLAIAFTDGTMQEVEDRIGGGTYHREKWLWLPKSRILIEDEDKDCWCTVHVPEWLAKEKGLL